MKKKPQGREKDKDKELNKEDEFAPDLKEEITAYLEEVRADLDQYLSWASEEIRNAEDPSRGSEIMEDTVRRMLLISYYLATFFEDADPSQLLADMTNQVAEEQAQEEARSHGKLFFADPGSNRTRH